MRRRCHLVWLLAAGLAIQPLAVQAQQAQQQELDQVQKKLAADEAKAAELKAREAAIRAEVAALTQELVAVAASAQALEGELTRLEASVAALEQERGERQAGLAAARDSLGATLAALIRIALQPPEALLADSAAPLDVARSALLLSVLVPELEQRGAALRAELERLAALQEALAAEKQALDEKGEALAREQGRIETLLARKEALAEIAAGERGEAEKRAARLAAEAADLRQLIAALEQEAAERAAQEAAEKAAAEKAAAEAAEAARKAAEQQAAEAEQEAAEPAAPPPQTATLAPGGTLRDFPASPGGLLLPARGTLLAGYGQARPDTGEESRGFLLQTRPGAQIVAPYDGRVVYAGVFRSYGLILILEHGGRYHSLLAGLGRIDVALGQGVVAGEPVGLMDAAAGAAPSLYIELRHNGQAIDPRPWFANQLSQGQTSKDEG